jgi:hypothetical protein
MSRWWVRAAGNVYGPVETSTLVESLRTGRIVPSDLACREGAREWLLVSSVPEVAEAFVPKPSVHPPAEQDPWTAAVWMVGNLDGEILAGPLSLAGVNERIAARHLTGDELLARVGNTSWRPIADVARDQQNALATRVPPTPTASFPPARASVAPPLPSRRPPPLPARATPAPQPRPVEDALEWWLARGGPIEGPFTTAQMRDALATGGLDSQTPACRGDRQEWRAVASFTELRSGSRPPPLPSRR